VHAAAPAEAATLDTDTETPAPVAPARTQEPRGWATSASAPGQDTAAAPALPRAEAVPWAARADITVEDAPAAASAAPAQAQAQAPAPAQAQAEEPEQEHAPASAGGIPVPAEPSTGDAQAPAAVRQQAPPRAAEPGVVAGGQADLHAGERRPDGPVDRTAPSTRPAPAAQAPGQAPDGALDGRAATGDTDRVAQAPRSARPAAAPQQPATVAAPPVEAQPSRAGERAQAAPVVRHAVALHELVEAARTVIRVAARDGQAQARITLHPAELGSVEIRLRYHATGVSADVLADSAQAAQALGQALPDLRRALEAQGMGVLWLDVRQGGGEERRPHGERTGRQGRSGGATPVDDETTIEPTRLPRPGSTLDVLA
jgi:flagellar hook-length control protein FliK